MMTERPPACAEQAPATMRQQGSRPAPEEEAISSSRTSSAGRSKRARTQPASPPPPMLLLSCDHPWRNWIIDAE